MTALFRFAPLLGLAVLAACSTPAPKPIAAVPPPAGVAAAPERCVNTSWIRESRVVSDSVIDFIMRDGKTYRNTLPYACSGLGFERAFAYKTSISQLCSVDTITVLHTGGGMHQGATCGLGVFVPYTPVKDAPPAK